MDAVALLVAAAAGAGACGYEMQTDGGWLPVTVGWSGQDAACGGHGHGVCGFTGARVVGRWPCIALFEGAEGFYRGGLCVRM